MPFEQSGVADGPYNFEDRLLRAMPRLDRLRLLVPERHDLALMKAVRGDQADFAKLQAIHARKPFDLSRLLRRYRLDRYHNSCIRPGRIAPVRAHTIGQKFPRS